MVYLYNSVLSTFATGEYLLALIDSKETPLTLKLGNSETAQGFGLRKQTDVGQTDAERSGAVRADVISFGIFVLIGVIS